MADYTKPAQINLVEKNPAAWCLRGPEVTPLPAVGTRSADPSTPRENKVSQDVAAEPRPVHSTFRFGRCCRDGSIIRMRQPRHGALGLHNTVKGNHLRRVDTARLEQDQPLTIGTIFMKATVASYPQHASAPVIRESVAGEFRLAEQECPSANLGPVIVDAERGQCVDQMDAE
jgi:hypothetical protein